MCGKDMLETREYSYRGVSIKYTCECGVSSIYYPGQEDDLIDDNNDVFVCFCSDSDIEKEVYK